MRSLVALALIFAGCRERPRPEAVPTPAPHIADAALSKRARHGGMDVTFFVVSDTHVGYQYPDDLSKLSSDPVASPVGLETDNKRLIARLNTLAGHVYPARFGGTVATPRGLVITGDLTEWSRPQEWERFVKLYGLHGTEGPLKVPVFEMVGNHDQITGPWMSERVAERHGSRFYSWDWDDLHLVALGEAPDDAGLAFLEQDLAKLEADVPVAVFFHRALLGPWSNESWFDDTFKKRLATTLEGHDVVAIFHGHHHATGHYQWNGLDVWKPGAVKHDAHTLAVVHITDARFRLSSYDWEHDSWASADEKPMRAR